MEDRGPGPQEYTWAGIALPERPAGARRTETVVISVPRCARSHGPVLKLEIDGALDVESWRSSRTRRERPSHAAVRRIEQSGLRALIIENKGGAPNIGYWDARAWVQWTHKIKKTRRAWPRHHRLAIKNLHQWGIDEGKQKSAIEPTGSFESFKTIDLGTVKIDATYCYLHNPSHRKSGSPST